MMALAILGDPVLPMRLVWLAASPSLRPARCKPYVPPLRLFLADIWALGSKFGTNAGIETRIVGLRFSGGFRPLILTPYVPDESPGAGNDAIQHGGNVRVSGGWLIGFLDHALHRAVQLLSCQGTGA